MYICFNVRDGYKSVEKRKKEGFGTKSYWEWVEFPATLGSYYETDINKSLDIILNYPKTLEPNGIDEYFSNFYTILNFVKNNKNNFTIKNTGFIIIKNPPTKEASVDYAIKPFYNTVANINLTNISNILKANIDLTLKKLETKIKLETIEKALILNLDDKFQMLHISCRLLKKVLMDNAPLEKLPTSYNYNSLSSFLMDEFNSFLMDFNFNFDDVFNYNNIKELKEFKLPLIVNKDYFIKLEKFNLKLILLFLENKEKINENTKSIIFSYIKSSDDNLSKILLKRFPIFNSFMFNSLV